MCSLCSLGKSSSEGATACTDCVVGKYSRGGLATPCNDCEAGKYINEEGGVTCTRCQRGAYSSGGASTCSDCPADHWSVVGSPSCYTKATGFETCPEHPVSTHVVDNECNYMFEGSWDEVSEGGASSFGNTCAALTMCEHESSELEDDYYLMCAECAEGKVVLGYNTEVRGECDAMGRFPVACVDPATFSTCPNGENIDDDCKYYKNGNWESVDAGEASPFNVGENNDCVAYAPCSTQYGTVSRLYHFSCTQCADGLFSFLDTSGDSSDDVPSTCHGKKISECYSVTKYATCPDQLGLDGQSSATLNNLAQCTYIAKEGVGGVVRGNQASPYISSCSQYELVSTSRQDTLTQYGYAYDYTIACKSCNEGLVAGDYMAVGGQEYIGSCYTPPSAGTGGDFSVCNTGGDNHGKDVVCKYLNGSDVATASWAEVSWGEEAPKDLRTGCSLWELCTHETDATNTTMQFMCKTCKEDHQATYNAITAGSCSSQGVYSTHCEFTGIPTESPTLSPTMAPQPVTPAPSAAPTQAPTEAYNFFKDMMARLNNAANNNLEVFMGVVALLLCLLGLGIYKCYAMEKYKLLYDENGERREERRMWSFDESDVIASGVSLGGSIRTGVGLIMGRGERSAGLSLREDSLEMRRLSEPETNDDDNLDWKVRTDPNGNTYYENMRTRATTWTDKRGGGGGGGGEAR